jgi:diguanylate cyclase (GGDEF)-like protein
MADTDKTIKQLLKELAKAHQRILELEQTESKRAQAEHEIQKQLRAQVALRNAGAAISSSLSTETVMNKIIEEMGKAVDATSAALNHIDPTSETITVIAEYTGPEANALEQKSFLNSVYPEIDDPFIEEKKERVRSGQHIVSHMDDADLTKYEREEMQDFGVKSILYIPLLMKNELIGYAELWETRQRREFTSAEVALCKDLAQQAAIALENARLYEQAKEEIKDRKQAEIELQKLNKQLQSQLDEISKLETKLREQAIRDPLTGVFNRRYMDAMLNKELARALRTKEPLSIVILDLDHLKTINDTYGHVEGGDKALQALADTLKQLTRVEDILCRYAGDEFIVILYHTSAKVAYERALEWKDAVSKIKIETDEGEFSITFSAGVAEFTTHDPTGESILIRADQALYRAKELGRDRVVIYQ